MLRTIFVFLMCLVMTAQAAPQKNWSFDFEVIGSKPTDSHMSGGTVFQSMAFNPDIGYTNPDGTVASDWSYITCSLENNHVIVDFKSTVANWPTSWPSTVTCTYPDPNGGSPFVLKLSLKNATYPYGYDWTPSGTAVITLEETGVHKDPGFFTYRLPNGNWYSPSTYTQAKRSNGTNWPGVYCGVKKKNSTVSYITVDVGPTADANTGYCRVKKIGQPWQNLPIKLVRP